MVSVILKDWDEDKEKEEKKRKSLKAEAAAAQAAAKAFAPNGGGTETTSVAESRCGLTIFYSMKLNIISHSFHSVCSALVCTALC